MSETQTSVVQRLQYDDHPIASIFPLMTEDELGELADDIKAHGLKNPIVLYEEKVLDGRNRYRACLEAGVEPRFEAYEGDAPTAHVLSLNLQRRHLTPSQRACVAVEAERHFAAEAKKRMLAGRKPDPGPKLDEGRADEKAAALVGVSRSYVGEAKSLKTRAPKLFEEVQTGEKTLQAAKRELNDRDQKAERKANAKRVASADTPSEVEGAFSTIVMTYLRPAKEWLSKGPPAREAEGSDPASGGEHRELPIPKVAADAAHLYLVLSTRDILAGEADRLCHSWGFSPQTILLTSVTPEGGDPHFGAPRVHLVFATKGSLATKSPRDPGIHWGGVRNMSPSELESVTYDLAERFSHAPYLEVFTQSKRKGWACWGAEAKAE